MTYMHNDVFLSLSAPPLTEQASVHRTRTPQLGELALIITPELDSIAHLINTSLYWVNNVFLDCGDMG